MTLTASELRTLAAIAEALLPADASEWAATVPKRASSYLRFLSPRERGQVRLVLRVLEHPLVSVFMLRRGWQAFSHLDVDMRRHILAGLMKSPLPFARAAVDGFKRLTAVAYYADSTPGGTNPTWTSIGYPGPIASAHDAPRPLPIHQIETDTLLSCDAVVIGSGPGGSVVAGELARRGWDVVVLEKGEYLAEPDFDQREVATLQRAYLDGGLTTTADRGVTIVAGSCLGGGSVVNFTTSFATPEPIRAEWEAMSHSPMFAKDSFSEAVAAVTERFGINTRHNQPAERDRLMERGLRALGWHVDAMPRNVLGCTQDDVCGYCGLGCIRGAKQSATRTYLADAAEHGARIVTECTADRVLSDNDGVRARATTRAGHRVEIAARVAVVGAGAIHTPAILMRSGLRGTVGHNLHLHPVTAVWGRFDTPVRPWTGTLQALYSDTFANLDNHYGARFESAPVHPAYLALASPWTTPLEFDARMRELPYLSIIGVLLRDRSAGRVRLDRSGRPVVQYALSKYDRDHVRTALIGAARVLEAAGAREIFSSQHQPARWKPASQPIGGWLDTVDRLGYSVHDTIYGSWHQMGSCRISKMPNACVDLFGEVHGLKNVFVADASLFPSASGVNPMVSIATLAFQVAKHVDERLHHSPTM